MAGLPQEKRVALVTGAAAGLGRAVALALGERGAAVALLDIERRGLGETARVLRDRGMSCCEIVADITRHGAPVDAVGSAVAAFGRVDILINNAATASVQRFLEITEEAWDSVFAVNVRGLLMMLQAAARYMKDHGGGRIVNITSPASRMALPNYTAYAASKAAVDSITRTAAVALAQLGILVNSVAPGMMDTEMQRRTEALLAAADGRDDFENFLEERTRRVPLGRRLEVSEAAAAVVWLALDAPAFITAERLNASGGMDKD